MSAVDGYALSGTGPEWAVTAAVAAGEVYPGPLAPGQCVRILTGAQVPAGADRVVMQERALVEAGRLRLDGPEPPAGANIRRTGEQFTAGELLLRQGERFKLVLSGI